MSRRTGRRCRSSRGRGPARRGPARRLTSGNQARGGYEGPGSFPGLRVSTKKGVGELAEEAQAGFAPIAFEAVNGCREPRDNRQLFLIVGRQHALGPARPKRAGQPRSTPDGRRARAAPSPGAEKSEALRAVEHLEHAERLLVVEERRCHEPARHVAGPFRDVAREAGIRADILGTRAGVRVASTQPAIPLPAGKRMPRSSSSPSPTTASNTSSSASTSRSRIGGRPGAEDGARRRPRRSRRAARGTTPRSRTTPAATAAWSSDFSVTTHLPRSSRSGRGRSSAGRASLGVLREDEGADRAQVRCREAVAGDG